MNATPDSELRGERSWPALLDVAPESDGIDLAAVRRYRQERVRAEMAARGIGAVILSDSVNIRYASGSRNMQVFTSRNAPSRYLVLTGDRSILFEFTGCEHLADGLDTIDEVRPALNDGVTEPGMTLCVESYIGAEDGTEGVKLEQQMLVTETGTELLSTFPFEQALLAPCLRHSG